MKKKYANPIAVIVKLTVKDTLMLVVSGETGSTNTGGDDDGTGETLSKENGNRWGNDDIWDNMW